MNQKTDSNTGSRKLFFLQGFYGCFICAMVAMAGCEGQQAPRLVGVWTMAKAGQLAQRVGAEGSESAQGADEAGGDAVALPMMSLHFRRGGVMETVTQLGKINSRKTGSWKVLETSQETPNTISIQCEIDDLVSQHEVSWTDEDTIRIAPPNMSGQKMKLKFTRTD